MAVRCSSCGLVLGQEFVGAAGERAVEPAVVGVRVPGPASRPRPVAGEGQEHVVEAGPVEVEVLDVDAGAARARRWRWRPARCPCRPAWTRCGGRRRSPTPSGGASRHSRSWRLRPAGRGRTSTISSVRPPVRSLSSSAVPSAMTVPWSITTIRSASSSASSRYWVVSSTVVPSATSSRVISHMLDAAGRVEPGGGLVEEQHAGPADQADGQVEPAAHAAGVGADLAVAGLGEVEPLEQLVGPLVGLGLASCRAGGRPSTGSRGR